MLNYDRERPVAVAAQARRAVADGIPVDRNLLTMSAAVVNPLPGAMRIADDCGHGHEPASRYVHRGRQAV